MLEEPNIQDEVIIACLRDEYGLLAAHVEFLPLGVDRNAAVYRVVADDVPYFLKLRRGDFDEICVALPRFLSEEGMAHIMAPVTTETGRLWASLESFKAILYPLVEGRDGYQVGLSDRQWVEFGAALKSLHTAVLPPALKGRIRQETYSAQGRESVRTFLERAEDGPSEDPVDIQLNAFLQAKREKILDLVGRAEGLAQALQRQSPELTVCHSDLHAGNILIDAAHDAFYLVDWDEPVLAPKERDLMFVGGGLLGKWRTPPEEEKLFYQGYGPTQVDPIALAYFRYERIIQDIAVFCDRIFLKAESVEDREQSFHYLEFNFLPNDTIEIAYESDKTGLSESDCC
jgi:spectinomycin phosphotransferase